MSDLPAGTSVTADRVGAWCRDPEGRSDRCALSKVTGMTGTWHAERVEQIRQLIVAAVPDVVEEAKWRKATNPDGVPTFSRNGLICTVETYKDKVKVTFAKGASLPDPTGVFNASLDAGTRRAVDLKENDELDADAFTDLVRAASM